MSALAADTARAAARFSTEALDPCYLSDIGADSIHEMNGVELLAAFRANRSETAFGELIRRYTNLVDSAAKRRLGSVALAQEVAQLVFIRLVRSNPRGIQHPGGTGLVHPRWCCFPVRMVDADAL